MLDPLGDQRGKVHPKLRMIANCSAQVNAIRAELSAAVAVEDKVAEEWPVVRGEELIPLTFLLGGTCDKRNVFRVS